MNKIPIILLLLILPLTICLAQVPHPDQTRLFHILIWFNQNLFENPSNLPQVTH